MRQKSLEPPGCSALVDALVERAAQPTFVLDATLRLLVCNAKFSRLVGQPQEELTGSGWLEVAVGENARRLARESLADVIQGVVQRVDVSARTKSGEEIVLCLQCHTVGAVNQVVAICMVTAVRRAALWAHSHLAGMRLYEISATRERFGFLEHVSLATQGDELAIGRPCFAGLHNARSPCANCPAFSSARPGDIRTGVVTRPGSASLSLATAEFTVEDTIRMSVRSVSDRDLRDLLAAKIDIIAQTAGLSERERKVLDLIIDGHDGAAIGELLKIATRTVKFHQANVLRKLGVDARVEILRLLL